MNCMNAHDRIFVWIAIMNDAGDPTTWTAAATPPIVPEPTTGMLVLLGVAGLALRRRRA